MKGKLMQKFLLAGFLFIFFLITAGSTTAYSVESYLGVSPQQYTIFSSKFSCPTPFWVKVADTKYYFVRARSDGNYSYKDLVGCDRKKKQLFEPFYEFDRDNDMTKITADELKAANIRLVAEKTNGRLALSDSSLDFPLENVLYIDMVSSATFSDRWARPSGTFVIYLKTERSSKEEYLGHLRYVHPKLLSGLF